MDERVQPDGLVPDGYGGVELHDLVFAAELRRLEVAYSSGVEVDGPFPGDNALVVDDVELAVIQIGRFNAAEGSEEDANLAR